MKLMKFSLFSAQSCTPSILLMENFEALGREKDASSYGEWPQLFRACSKLSEFKTWEDPYPRGRTHFIQWKFPNDRNRRIFLGFSSEENERKIIYCYLLPDVRIASSFGQTVRKCWEKCDRALIIIATTSSTKINPDMLEVFLHEITIPVSTSYTKSPYR